MQESGAVIDVGCPGSDGDHLVSGFGYPDMVQGESCRWTGEVARLHIGCNAVNLQTLKLRLYSDIAQRISVTIDNNKPNSITVTPKAWLEFDIPVGQLSPSDGLAYLLIEGKVNEQNRTRGYRAIALSRIEYTYVTELQQSLASSDESSQDQAKYHGERTISEFTRAFEGFKFFWGDPHVHTNISLCDAPYEGSVSENIQELKDVRKLDFGALADHAEHMSDSDEAMTRKAWEDNCAEGSFQLLPAYEWTSDYYGHMNVYSPCPDIPLLYANRTESDTPRKLWSRLRDSGCKCITVPHHPTKRMFPFDWDYYDPEYMRCVEIYSKWGSSEVWQSDLQPSTGTYATYPGLSVQDALMRGYRLGLMGGGDCHILKAGSRGITGVLLKKLSRDALFEALQARRTVATTGPRTQIYFSLNGQLMGSEIVLTRYQLEKMIPLTLYIEVSSPESIKCVELIENNQVIRRETISTTGGCFALPYVRRNEDIDTFRQFSFIHKVEPDLKGLYSRFYYVRVTNQNRHMAWCSPIWLATRENETRASTLAKAPH